MKSKKHFNWVLLSLFLLTSHFVIGQSETEFYSDGIVIPKVSVKDVSSPIEGQIIYATGANELAVYNGTTWVYASGSSSFWESTTHGITYNGKDNVGIGVVANPVTKLFVQGNYNEDPFRVQIGREDDPNGGDTKMRILAKYNSMVLGSSWNSIDSSHLDALWSNYKKNYFRDSLQLRNPSEDPAILMTKGSGLVIFDTNGDEVIEMDRAGLATLDDLSVSEQASFGKGLISSDPIRIKENGNGPAGPAIEFMDDNSTTSVVASIKVTNSTGSGNNHDMIFNNNEVGKMVFNPNNGVTNFRMRGNINESFVTLAPVTTNNIDLGNTDLRWRTIYAQNSLNTSDLRLKKNVVSLDDSVLSKILKLNATAYHYKTDEPGSKRTIGFIAQEVEKINPDWVVPPSHDEDHYLINYDNFTVLAIKAIQEQQEIISSLQEEIKSIKLELKK